MIATLAASIPSPSQGVWHLGPVPLRAYALAIIAGIVAAAWLTSKRWAARGGDPEEVITITYWAVPFGIVGGRIYHVFSSPDAYWGEGGEPIRALYIWQGGLGVWGAVALGAVGAYIGCRREGVRFSSFADAVAPGLLVAQAIGRLGNWFNQELFGGPTTLPWGLEVDPAVAVAAGETAGTLFHPTFLYELLWNLAAAALIIWLDRRYRLGGGRVFFLYVALYTAGRVWIEMLRIDPAEQVLGLRLNVWTSILLGFGAVVAFVATTRRGAPRESTVYLDPERAAVSSEVAAAGSGTDADEEPATVGDPTAAEPDVAPQDSGTDPVQGRSSQM